jgi:hypothetical protein
MFDTVLKLSGHLKTPSAPEFNISLVFSMSVEFYHGINMAEPSLLVKQKLALKINEQINPLGDK